MTSPILFVTQFLPPATQPNQTGGTISNLKMLAAISKDHRVVILSFDPTTNAAELDEMGITAVCHPAPSWRWPQLIAKWPGFVQKHTQDAINVIGEPSIVMATNASLPALDVVTLKARRVAVIQAYESFGLSCPWVPHKRRINLFKLAAVHRFQHLRLLRQADTVITNSLFMRSAIEQRFDIDEYKIRVMPQVADVMPILQPEPPSNSVGFIHRGADKNIAMVIDIASRAPDLQFVIYGHTADIDHTLPQNIVVRGWENDRNLVFSSAALWIVPSLWAEPFGRVSIEAQAANRSVLVANAGGLPETVVDRSCVVDGYDPDTWLARIRHAMNRSKDEIARNGNHIREQFSSSRHDEAYKILFEEMTGGIH